MKRIKHINNLIIFQTEDSKYLVRRLTTVHGIFENYEEAISYCNNNTSYIRK